MTELPCPICGSELAFLEQYQRYYCYSCRNYAPEGYGSRGAKKCPTCGGILSYVAQYDRFFCFRCNAYALGDVTVPAAAEPATASEMTSKAEPTPATEPTAAATPTATKPMEAAQVILSPQPILPPAPQPAAPVETREAPPSPAPARPSEPIAAKPADVAVEKPAIAPPVVKPAVLRVRIFLMKKPELMDLCRTYALEPTGTKEQLQERLLSYLSDLEEESHPSVEESTPAPDAVSEPTKQEKAEAPATPPAVASPLTAVQVRIEETPEPSPLMASGSPSQAVLVEEAPTKGAIPDVIPVMLTPEPPAAPRVGHPCTTCGRELSYISQYNRWYCYFCQKYAPATKPKNACPTCGKILRWIDPYQRWWCDACQKYASADLPKPAASSAVAQPHVVREVAKPVATETVSRPAIAAQRHRQPGTGIGLLAFGLVLFIVEEILVELPSVFSLNLGINVPVEYAVVIRFFAFLLVALGAIVGLWALRENR